MSGSFISSVRFQAKTGQEEVLIKAVSQFDVSQYPGCHSHQIVDAGNGRFQTTIVWDNKDAIAAARPELIKFLNALRPMLDEISPELGVTDSISGPIID